MKITQHWLEARFQQQFIEGDEGNGVYYVKPLIDDPHCDLFLMSSNANDFLEVIMFPFEGVRFQTTEQVESIYKCITNKLL